MRLLALFAAYALLGLTSLSCPAAEMPRYEHIFIIIAENKSFDRIIGNGDAPRINDFARKFGLATRYYGVRHPSQPNYIAMVGGDTFGIADNDAWYCVPAKADPFCDNSGKPNYVTHSLSARSLMDQLEEAKLTWKGYFEDLPHPGSTAIYHPDPQKPVPNQPPRLYAAKHNSFVSFERVRADPEIAKKIVPLAQLDDDLANGTAPNYAHIVLSQCNDMHGLTRDTPSAFDECVKTANVIRRGDAAIGKIVDGIMGSKLWTKASNAAIVITWDEDDYSTHGEIGCCGASKTEPANMGGGHVPTIVITNHGPRGVLDDTPYNHYSLLRTCEEAFGIREFLGWAGADGKGVRPMLPLFAIPDARP